MLCGEAVFEIQNYKIGNRVGILNSFQDLIQKAKDNKRSPGIVNVTLQQLLFDSYPATVTLRQAQGDTTNVLCQSELVED